MKLAVLAAKAARLPEIDFQWPGPEHFCQDVFDREVKTLPQAIEYIDDLRKSMAKYSMALHDLTTAYRTLRELMLEADVEHS
jgi:hypothetical protein